MNGNAGVCGFPFFWPHYPLLFVNTKKNSLNQNMHTIALRKFHQINPLWFLSRFIDFIAWFISNWRKHKHSIQNFSHEKINERKNIWAKMFWREKCFSFKFSTFSLWEEKLNTKTALFNFLISKRIKFLIVNNTVPFYL